MKFWLNIIPCGRLLVCGPISVQNRQPQEGFAVDKMNTGSS